MIPHDYNNNTQEQEENGEKGEEEPTGQVRLCYAKTIQESHKKVIYCIAWSRDVHQDDITTTGTRSSSSSSILHNDDNNNVVRSCSSNTNAAASVTDDSRRVVLGVMQYRYMATCAGRHVCVYQVPILNKKDSTSSSSSTTTTTISSSLCSSSSTAQSSSIMNMTIDDMDDVVAANDAKVQEVVVPEIEMIQSYMDSDTTMEEDFYTCVFAGRSNVKFATRTTTTTTSIGNRHQANNNYNNEIFSGETGTGPQLLCVAGLGRSIKVIDTVRQELVATLYGHGKDIYDLKLSPINDFMLLSASKDRSIRLWNLKIGVMVAIFAGSCCHCDDVVSISWHVSGHRFVSSGMDRKILIWNVGPGTEVYQAIQNSHSVAKHFFETGQRDYEKRIQCISPIFATTKVHFYCVDCVQFVGDLILSRAAVDETIVLWEPMILMPDPESLSLSKIDEPLYPIPSQFEHLRTFRGMDHADYWFIRFGTDASHGHKTLACGNNVGDIFLWDIDAETGELPFVKLKWTTTCSSNGKKKGGIDQRKKKRTAAEMTGPRAVRWVSFSPDGNILIASTDEGKLYVWDVVR